MKRFWTEVGIERTEAGHGIVLDGRPVRTPGRRPLQLPGAALADAVAAEWRAVEGFVRPDALPLTGIANAAIDIVAPDVPAFAAGLARYALTDLLCYRAEGPHALVARQVAAWEPPLKALEARHGLLFRRTAGIVPVAQPDATLARVTDLLERSGPWALAPLQPIVAIGGSLVLGLAMLDGMIDAQACWFAARLDEEWQAEHWGHDEDAAAQELARRRDFMAAAEFLRLLAAGDGRPGC